MSLSTTPLLTTTKTPLILPTRPRSVMTSNVFKCIFSPGGKICIALACGLALFGCVQGAAKRVDVSVPSGIAATVVVWLLLKCCSKAQSKHGDDDDDDDTPVNKWTSGLEAILESIVSDTSRQVVNVSLKTWSAPPSREAAAIAAVVMSACAAATARVLSRKPVPDYCHRCNVVVVTLAVAADKDVKAALVGTVTEETGT